MEQNPADSEDKNTPDGKNAKSKPALTPLARLVRGDAEAFARPEEKVPPKLGSLLEMESKLEAPTMPEKAETAPEPAPEVPPPLLPETWQPPRPEKISEEDEDDEDDDAPTPSPKAPPTSHPLAARSAEDIQPIEEVLPPVVEALPEAERPPGSPDQEPATIWQQERFSPTPPEPQFERPPEPPAAERLVPPHQHPELGHQVREARIDAAAGFATSVLIGWWLRRGQKRLEREQVKTAQQFERAYEHQAADSQYVRSQVHEQGRQLEQLTRPGPHPYFAEKPPVPAAQAEAFRQRAVAAEQAVAEAHELQRGLQPGQHIERTWYDEVVDEHGRVVQGAIEHGRAFQEEQAVERAAIQSAQSAGSTPPGVLGGGGQPVFGAGMTVPTPSGALPTITTDAAHRLPNGEADPQHLLGSHSGLNSSLSDPWVWVGVGVLILAFLGALFL